MTASRAQSSIAKLGRAPASTMPGVAAGRISAVFLSAALLVFATPAAPARAATTICDFGPEAYTSGVLGNPDAPVDDPLFDRQWALDQINAPEAWARGAFGEGATVAVLDTGVDFAHPEFSGRLLAGYDGLEDVSGAEDCPGPQDESGHGTGAAGIIGAGADNGIGVAGVAPRSTLMPVRVWRSPAEAPDWNALAAGLRYATDAGAHVISISLFTNLRDVTDETGASELAQALEYAWDQGAIVVANAGNNTRPYCGFPARSPHVVCVAATARSGLPSSFSHLPFHLNGGIALRAPGGEKSLEEQLPPPLYAFPCERDDGVWLALWPGAVVDCPNAFRGYDTGAGGSWGPPHVAGVVALLAGGGLTNVEIAECLKETSSNKGDFDPVMGYGIVDAGAAVVSCLPSVPQVELEVTPATVDGRQKVDVAAGVFDPDGISDLESVMLGVTDSRGRLIRRWTEEDFATEGNWLTLAVDGLDLRGPAPWTVSITARDKLGDTAVEERFVTRDDRR